MESEYECSWPYGERVDDETIEMPVRGDPVRFALTEEEVNETFSISEYTLDPAVFYFVDHLEPGDVFYDVGAHIGSFSTVVGALCPEVDVVAFEPHSMVREKLQENLSVNGIDADVYGYGMGGENGVGTWTPSGSSKCMASVAAPTGAVKNNHQETLQCRTLDRVVEEHDLPLPTMLKLDVEGHELPFLRNAERVLASDAVKQLDVEIHPPAVEDRNGSVADIVTVLESYGFTVYHPNGNDILQIDHAFNISAWKDDPELPKDKHMRFFSRNTDDE